MQLEENKLFAHRYRLKQLLGRGGFSEVWLAEDTLTDLEVALKVYAPGGGMDERGVQLFSSEFSLVFNLNHSNLLKPTYYDTFERMPYLVLPYCELGSAANLIGQLDEQTAWRFLYDMACGLEYLHSQEPPVIHQDIKPDNILLDHSGRYLLTDFGISIKARNTLRKSMLKNEGSVGTLAYMGPERFSKYPLPIKASDIFSLGATLYELLTGLTYLLFRPSVPQISIGHQYLFLHRDFEFPHKKNSGIRLLRFFTRLTCLGAKEKLALSFHEMDDDPKEHIRVVPPLLRKEVLSCEGTCGNYLHGYMVNAGFGENIRAWHRLHPEVPLHFFWDKPDEKEECRIDDTLSFHQIDDAKFLRYMSGCRAYATTAGFESVCEAMYLGKPLLMVPAHIEQDCNAYDAVRTGAGITADEFDLERLLTFSQTFRPNPAFRYWARSYEGYILPRIEAAATLHRYTSTLLFPIPT